MVECKLLVATELAMVEAEAVEMLEEAVAVRTQEEGQS